MEIWRDIKGYEGLYQVSNYGRVKSLERVVERKSKYGKCSNYRHKSRIIKQYAFDNCGHLQVDLHKDNTKNHKQVHRLVAEAFIPNPNNYDVVHHKDHDVNNNKVENLEWMDKGEHTSMHTTESLGKTTYQYTLDGKLLAIYISANEAAKQLGYNVTDISRCCNGGFYHKGKWHKRETSGGYRWSYTPL